MALVPKWVEVVRGDSDARQSFEEWAEQERKAAIAILVQADDPDARATVRVIDRLCLAVVREEREEAQFAGYRQAAGIQ